MSLKVLYDSQGIDFQHFGGVSRCFAELYSHLPADVTGIVAARGTHNVYMRPILAAQRTKRWHLPQWRLVERWIADNPLRLHSWRTINRAYSCQLLERGDYDLLHATFFDTYFLPLLKGKPFVLTIHDMIPERFPDLFPAHDEERAAKRELAQRAAHIVTVSKTTRDEIVHFLGINPSKISVIYHATSDVPFVAPAVRPVPERYILYVGARANYKRFREFLVACVPVLRRHAELKVVCTGAAFSASEQDYFRTLGVANRLVHCYAPTDEALLALYHFAEAFVYPSAMEGFGIPILEAYKAGCPVMLSDNPCFREVAGEAATYFQLDAQGTSDFADAFEKILCAAPSERDAFLERQRERLSRYTWDKSAAQLAAVYHQVAGR